MKKHDDKDHWEFSQRREQGHVPIIIFELRKNFPFFSNGYKTFNFFVVNFCDTEPVDENRKRDQDKNGTEKTQNFDKWGQVNLLELKKREESTLESINHELSVKAIPL